MTAVRQLHAFCEKAGLKGQQLCRLPGVAITCAAIALSCRKYKDLPTLLKQFLDVLLTDMPILHFDSLEGGEGAECVANASPLQIVVQERNVLARTTTSTTRHMADILAQAAMASFLVDPMRVDYDAWRDAHMVRCLRVRPANTAERCRTPSTAVCSNLDGHPLLESLHIGEEDKGCAESVLLVRVTIRPRCDSRYAFGDGCVVGEDGGDGAVQVTRGKGKSWPLMVSPRKATATWEEASQSQQMLPCLGGSIPNRAHPVGGRGRVVRRQVVDPTLLVSDPKPVTNVLHHVGREPRAGGERGEVEAAVGERAVCQGMVGLDAPLSSDGVRGGAVLAVREREVRHDAREEGGRVVVAAGCRGGS